MRKFNATQIKFFMAALMVLDHIPHIHGLVPPLWEGIFRALTRCVGVWFAYTAVGDLSTPTVGSPITCDVSSAPG